MPKLINQKAKNNCISLKRPGKLAWCENLV